MPRVKRTASRLGRRWWTMNRTGCRFFRGDAEVIGKSDLGKTRRLKMRKCTRRQYDPDGIRTRVAALKGPCPRPLDDGANTPMLEPLAGFVKLPRPTVCGNAESL